MRPVTTREKGVCAQSGHLRLGSLRPQKHGSVIAMAPFAIRAMGVGRRGTKRQVWLSHSGRCCSLRFERGLDDTEGSGPQWRDGFPESTGIHPRHLEAQCHNDSLQGALSTLDSLRALSATESLRRSTPFASNGVAWSERSGKEKEPQASIRPNFRLAITTRTSRKEFCSSNQICNGLKFMTLPVHRVWETEV